MCLCVRVCVFEADVPKKCKAAAGVWGCWKGKAQSQKNISDFFHLKYVKMAILNKVKIRLKYHNNCSAVTLKYVGDVLNLR